MCIGVCDTTTAHQHADPEITRGPFFWGTGITGRDKSPDQPAARRPLVSDLDQTAPFA